MSQNEVNKLQQHLSLLKQEFTKLRIKYEEIEQKYNAIAASNPNEDTFASRLLATVHSLHNTAAYSDLSILRRDGAPFPAHRIVLAARSAQWARIDADTLDWSHLEPDTADALLRWLYTTQIRFAGEDATLKIVRAAFDFKLDALVASCERYLTGIVTIRTCVKFYSVAEEIQAENLREYCSGLISTHWDELNAADFEHMSGPLLYQMLKNKSQLALHSAVRLQREDVVFLCLVENASKLSDIVNVWSPSGELPLDLALRSHNASIAATLVQHNADVNLRDMDGDTLLHRAIKHDDSFGALFLLENNCDATLTTRNETDTALHLIANAINLEQAVEIGAKLIRRGLNINATNRLGFSALQIAIQAENVPIFELILAEEGVDVNSKTSKQHPALYYALLKYETGNDIFLEKLIAKKPHFDAIYDTGENLLQILIEARAEKAAIYLATHTTNPNHVNSNGETPLHYACRRRLAGLVKKLLEIGANANLLANESRQAALHYAVLANAADCVDVMVERNEGVNFNVRDIEGETALSLALQARESGGLVPVLIKGGADVNLRNGKDLTLLHQAILKEDAETALFLLDNGADINAKTADSESPLQLAIHCRLPDVVDSLCIRGVDMSAPDRLGSCALWSALDSAQDEIASILVRHGADTDCWSPTGPDSCRQTLLHRAIDENKEPAAIFLIQAGCDLNAPRMPGEEGQGGEEAHDRASPLHLCATWGLETVLRTLVEHRANVNARDCMNRTPLHLAIENQHDEIIAVLLSVPDIDLTLRDKGGLSPFAAALTYRNNKAAQAILDKYPNAAEQFDSKGQNFLHIAIKKGDFESALFLLTVNVDVNSRVQDPMLTPPIHLASRFGNETLIRSLILAGARVDDRDAQKRTALHVAAEVGNSAAAVALLQNQANFDALDVESDNALHIAVREGHLNVVRALLTESSIDAEAVNLKGRNPLHELCKYGKDNAAAICELFLECMPEYPINKTDIMGNSPLLLAYMKGNGNLCRVLVKARACLGTENADRVTIFNYQVPSKQLLNRLLDQLGQAAVWTSTDLCQECGKGFSITVRTHHCRHCGRALCSKCSDQEVPIIKFGENKPVRVCRVCFDVLKTGGN